ncbi:unnamed protein product [marine sediment metagenome]|uniref:Uncharacterized protein n=1 Tax=marine sediment metagenome TaxID=412755 RepID=X0ZAC7_9ZZZZ
MKKMIITMVVAMLLFTGCGGGATKGRMLLNEGKTNVEMATYFEQRAIDALIIGKGNYYSNMATYYLMKEMYEAMDLEPIK